MAYLSDILENKPIWFNTKMITRTREGITIRVLEDKKRIYTVLKIPPNISVEQLDELSYQCRDKALEYFHTYFEDESFAELWNFSTKTEIVYLARRPLLNKAKAAFINGYIRTKYPVSFNLISSFKDNEIKGLQMVESYTKNIIGKCILESDTIDYIFSDTLSKDFPRLTDRHFLWDSHDEQGIQEAAKELQYLPKKVKNAVINRIRKRYGRRTNSHTPVYPRFIQYDAYRNTDNNLRSTELCDLPIVNESLELSKIQELLANHEALETLTEKQKEVIFLRYKSGLKQSEIARKLGKSRQTVSEIEKAAMKKIGTSSSH